MSADPQRYYSCPICQAQFETELELHLHVDAEDDGITEASVWQRHLRVLLNRCVAARSGSNGDPRCDARVNIRGAFASVAQQFETATPEMKTELLMMQLLSSHVCSEDSVATLLPEETDAFRKLMVKLFATMKFKPKLVGKEPSADVRLCIDVFRCIPDEWFLPSLVCFADKEWRKVCDEKALPVMNECDAMLKKLLDDRKSHLIKENGNSQWDIVAQQQLPYGICEKSNCWFPRSDLIAVGANKQLWSTYEIRLHVLQLTAHPEEAQVQESLLEFRRTLAEGATKDLATAATPVSFSSFVTAKGFFSCPLNDNHQIPTIVKLPAGHMNNRRFGVYCASCNKVWCSHCKGIHHPRNTDCSLVQLYAQMCINGRSLEEYQSAAESSFKAAEESLAELRRCVAAFNADSFEATKKAKLLAIDQSISSVRENIALKHKALVQHRENDDQWINQGAARCPYCGRQPLIRTGGCDVFGCGSHAHQAANVNGGCGREFSYSTYKYQRTDDSAIRNSLACYEQNLRDLENSRRQIDAMRVDVEVRITPPEPVRLWPNMTCSKCHNTFEGPFRLECVNCPKVVSLCMACVRRGDHFDLGPETHRRARDVPSVHVSLSVREANLSVSGGVRNFPDREVHTWVQIFNGAATNVDPDAVVLNLP
jgi:hypothetical protein